MLKLISRVAVHITRRGTGLFKLLFTVDDFLRLFTMTLLFPIFFSALGFGKTMLIFGTILGLIVDLHDFITEAGSGKKI